LCEEYNISFDFGQQRIRDFAGYVKSIDPYDHPITVHSAGDPIEALRFTFGDERFSLTSIQLGQRKTDTLTEKFRTATAAAGRPLPVSMDEFTIGRGQDRNSVPVNDTERWRKEKLWPTYLSGGNIEFILGDRLETDTFKTPEHEKLWDYVWYARRFLENLPFHEMEAADELVNAAANIAVTLNHSHMQYQMGAQVFAKHSKVYAIWLPTGVATGSINQREVTGQFTLQWYNPRTGNYVGKQKTICGGGPVPLGSPPSDVEQDWCVLIQ
jgi:hypothetical protein